MDSKTLLTGTITLLLLLVLMGIDDFYSWLSLTLVAYLASALFVIPIAYAIMKKQLDEKTIHTIALGCVVWLAYIFISKQTVEAAAISLLQTIVVITLLSTLVNSIKKHII